MKPVFGGFETRLKFIKFGHRLLKWYPGLEPEVLRAMADLPKSGDHARSVD